jgi:arylsulfatase A-like enzyme
MSAIFFAAGKTVGQGTIAKVHNIDVAPTLLTLLGMPPEPTMQGKAIELAER